MVSLGYSVWCVESVRFCDENCSRLPKQKGNFQSNSLFGGHESIYDIIIFQNIPFTELVAKLKYWNFSKFRIAKFSIGTVSR